MSDHRYPERLAPAREDYTLECGSTQMIPNVLAKIARNTAKPNKRKVRA
jgi:hypothetical protein